MTDSETHPRGVPNLTTDEYREFRRQVEEFDPPAEMCEAIDRHRRAIRGDE